MNSIDKIKTILSLASELKVYDISPVFETNMPGWSSHPTLGIIEDARNFDQNGYFAQTLVMSEHTGSHVDAPRHNHKSLASIDEFSPDVLIGPYKKYDLTPYQPKAGEPVSLELIKDVEKRDGFQLEHGDIALLQFGWDVYYKSGLSGDPVEREWWGKNEPGLTEDACRYFYQSGINAIGSDTAAVDICVVDGVIKSAYGHAEYFLPNNILIMEGFQNMDAAPATGIFLAIPLRIKSGSGSPIRPLLLA